MIKLFITLLLLLNSGASIADKDIAAEIKAAILKNIEHTQNENLDKTMSTFHSQSPSYLPTKNALAIMFNNYSLKYKLESYKYIAYDGDLAYVRIKQSTTKISGPAFNNNELDAVQVFRKEAGQWKLWSQMNISINYIK